MIAGELRGPSRLTGRSLAAAALRAYHRLLSPVLPQACRYWPSCSEYAAEAIARHGIARGLLRALRRIGRCHPFAAGGYDPVR